MCKAKMKNSSVHGKANLVQQAKSNKDEVFDIYYQRVLGKKIAPLHQTWK